MTERIVCFRPIDRVEEVFEGFDVEVVEARKYTEDELVEVVAGASALFTRSENRFTGRVMDAAGPLEVIAKPGSGVDNIDLDAATERGIVVAHTPGANAVAVAEYNVGLLVSLLRHIPGGIDHLREGGWRSEAWWGPQIEGKTVGILGLGHTGYETAKRFAGFGVDLLVADPYVPEERAEEVGATMVGFEDLLERSDFVLVHVRLTEDTEGLIGEDELARMQSSAYLVNTSRGPIVDTDALADAVRTGSIAGAAVDVYEEEPPDPDNPLLGMEDVIATPHLAGATYEARYGMLRGAAELAVDVLNGERLDPSDVANPDVLDR